MAKKIAVGFVVYNPNENLILRMKNALSSDFELYIFDNSPDDSTVRSFCNNRKNIKYVTCGKNVGLGLGISTVCALAYYDAHTALLFFDQDTVFSRETLLFIEKIYLDNFSLTSNYSAFSFNSRNYCGTEVDGETNFNNVSLAINSGSLYMLDNLKRLNWHDETYFVDGVDYNFCLNSVNNNLKIGEFSATPGFDHATEQDSSEQYSTFGKLYSLRAYSGNRILDAISASIKLIYKSICTLNVRFAINIARLYFKYLVLQVIVRPLIIRKRFYK